MSKAVNFPKQRILLILYSILGWDKPEATTDENEDYIPTEDVDLVPFSDLDDD